MEGGIHVENTSVALLGKGETVLVTGTTKSGGYLLNEDVNLEIKGGNNLKSQSITFVGSNDFSSSFVNGEIRSIKKEKSSNLWWILLVSIGGALILCVAGFLIYRKYSQNKQVSQEEHRLLEE
jgi:hypothetical protein